jgi:NADH-quinone oxidoreductase subunit D
MTDRHDALPGLNTREMLIQMGPSHPAMHGTVKMDLTLDGETVVDVDIHVGFLHRGFEKMCETHTWNQCFPYTDRLNYVSPLINNVGFALAVEKLLGIQVPERTQYIRTIVSEVSRIMDHLTAVAAGSLELGGFTGMLWAIEARDYYYRFIEKLTGARVTPSYCRIGGLRDDLHQDAEAELEEYAKNTERLMLDVEKLLNKNRIFIDRTAGVGAISAADAIDWGFTGVVLRSTGHAYDVRKDHPYLVYDRVDFDVPVGVHGDNFDRYLLRMEEIRQSLRIIRQCFEQLPEGPINVADWQVIMPPKQEVYDTIEGMISQFKLVYEGPAITPGEAYGYVEGGNGEVGFYVVSDGTGTAYRVHVRPPCFSFMQGLSDMITGEMVADIIPTFDSINMIGGEIDR